MVGGGCVPGLDGGGGVGVVGGGVVGGGDAGVGVVVLVGVVLGPVGVDGVEGGDGVGVGEGVGEGVGPGGFGLGFGFGAPGRGFGAGAPAPATLSAGPRATREDESAFVPDARGRWAARFGIWAGGNSAAWAGVIRLGATDWFPEREPVSNAARHR